MKKKILHFYSLITLLLFINSCTYLPPDIPLTEVEKPSDQAPDIFIRLTPEINILRLAASANVTYSFDAGNREIYQIKFTLDGDQLPEMNYFSRDSVYAYIPVESVDNGMHLLNILTYIATNSGSIADKIQAEQYYYEVSWPVYINKLARDSIKISSVKPVPEGIRIQWYLYDYADFQNYKLTRYSRITQQGIELINTNDPYLNSIVDTNYVEGEYVQYWLNTTFDGLLTSNVDYFEEIKKPEVSVNPDRSYQVRWSPSKYRQNLKSYDIQTSAPIFGIPEELEINDLKDTTAQFNEKLGFGGNYELQLRYIPKGFNGYYSFEVAGGHSSFALGTSAPEFQKGFSLPEENCMLAYNNGTFSKYNYLTGSTIFKKSITPIEATELQFIVSSPDGKLLGYFENHQFIVVKTSDWSLVYQRDIEAYSGYNLSLKCISLSNNGIVATAGNLNEFKIFDLNTGEKLIDKGWDYTFNLQSSALSPDGKNVCYKLVDYSNETCSIQNFKIENKQLVKIGELKTSSDYQSSFFFSPVSNKIIFFNYLGSYNYQINIINPSTMDIEITENIPTMFVPIAYDFMNDRAIAQYQFFPCKNYSYLIDLKNKKQTKVIQFCGSAPVLFSGNEVFAGNGRSIKIDDYLIE